MTTDVRPTSYVKGDADPTPRRAVLGDCPATGVSAAGDSYDCTWAAGHTHLQHVAGDGRVVRHVWPVPA